jgi:hypothetical protein
MVNMLTWPLAAHGVAPFEKSRDGRLPALAKLIANTTLPGFIGWESMSGENGLDAQSFLRQTSSHNKMS